MRRLEKEQSRMPLQDDIRNAMTQGGDLVVTFDQALNALYPGSRQVYLVATDDGGVRINANGPGEQATILWLPYRQGEITELLASVIAAAADDTLFFTYYLSGCKVFAIQGGPVWHSDAEIDAATFWDRVQSDEWVEDNWPAGDPQQVAYIRRAGQSANLWDLSPYLVGAPPSTYGDGNVGQATVGGVVTGGQLAFYYQTSPWQVLPYATQTMKTS
jgi:hypothetical protein